MSTRRVVVGKVGRPHGIRGEVSVEPRTDEPDRRFAVGTVLTTEAPRGPARPPALTVGASRRHQDRLLVRFEELPDRTAAEAARGLLLVLDVPADEEPEDPEEFYDHQLVGLRVETTAGDAVGEVTAIEHGAAQDLLVVRRDHGGEALVPFVTRLVPVIDVPARRVVVEAVPGLLEDLPEEG
jgi:16S rRNA processing protein RimM